MAPPSKPIPIPVKKSSKNDPLPPRKKSRSAGTEETRGRSLFTHPANPFGRGAYYAEPQQSERPESASSQRLFDMEFSMIDLEQQQEGNAANPGGGGLSGTVGNDGKTGAAGSGDKSGDEENNRKGGRAKVIVLQPWPEVQSRSSLTGA